MDVSLNHTVTFSPLDWLFRVEMDVETLYIMKNLAYLVKFVAFETDCISIRLEKGLR